MDQQDTSDYGAIVGQADWNNGVDWKSFGGEPICAADSSSTIFSSASAISTTSNYTDATAMTSMSRSYTVEPLSTEKFGYLTEFGDMSLEEPSSTSFLPKNKPTPSSIPWNMEVMKVDEFYDFIIEKGKEPYLRLKERYHNDPALYIPQLVYLNEERNSHDKNRHPCLYPGRSCWKPSQPVFRRSADLERHYNVVHYGSPAMRFPCDYPKCSRHDDPFTRKDHCRDHYKEYHKEDIGGFKGEKSAKDRARWEEKQSEWEAERHREPEWWRCSKCLDRVYVKKNGWTCSGCKRECEGTRIHARIQQPTTGVDDKSLVNSSLQTSDYRSPYPGYPYCSVCRDTGSVENQFGDFDACPSCMGPIYEELPYDESPYEEPRYEQLPSRWSYDPSVAVSVAPVKVTSKETSSTKTNPQQACSSLRNIPPPDEEQDGSSILQQRSHLVSGMGSLDLNPIQSHFQSSSLLLGKSLGEDCKRNRYETIPERTELVQDCVSQPDQNGDSEGTNTTSTTDESGYESEMSLVEEVETILGPDFSHLAALVITKIDLLSRKYLGLWQFEGGNRCVGDRTSTPSHTLGTSVSTTSSDTSGGKRKSNSSSKNNQINDGDDGDGDADEHRGPKKRKNNSSKTESPRYDCPVSKRAINAESEQPSQSRACAPGGLEFRHAWQHIRNTHYGCDKCGKSLKEKNADRKHLIEREKNPAACTAKAQDSFPFEVGIDLFDEMESIYYEKLPHKEKWIKWWLVTHPNEFQAPDPLHHGKLTISMEDIPHLQDLFRDMWFGEPSLPSMDDKQTETMLGLLERLFQLFPTMHRRRRQRTQAQTPSFDEHLSQALSHVIGMPISHELVDIEWGEIDFMSDTTGVNLSKAALQTSNENYAFDFGDTNFASQQQQFSGEHNETSSI